MSLGSKVWTSFTWRQYYHGHEHQQNCPPAAKVNSLQLVSASTLAAWAIKAGAQQFNQRSSAISMSKVRHSCFHEIGCTHYGLDDMSVVGLILIRSLEATVLQIAFCSSIVAGCDVSTIS
jgi:hypothetical protein